ncbi:MAG: hypothetical protein ACRERY_04640 [Pseudomonas sp.]
MLGAIAERRIQPSGNLIGVNGAPSPGRVPGGIEITDPGLGAYAASVPGGAYAQTAIYSQHFHHLAVMRKMLLRMAAWMSYLFPFLDSPAPGLNEARRPAWAGRFQRVQPSPP